jgi:alpha-tubulin suppressor-like RCC1 family protein
VLVALALALSAVIASPARAARAARTPPVPYVAEAWGFNKYGELGNGTTESSAVPVEVSGLRGVTAIAGGSRHGLALLDAGTVMAWGENFYGQLGDGTKASSDVPVAVTGLSQVAAISAGENHSLALLEDGTVMAWGRNSSGQLGDGATSNSDLPVAVRGLTGVKAISAGGGFSLALLTDGTVMAWGENARGQLGDGTKEGSDVPVLVSGLSTVTAISAGSRHSLALLSDGMVVAWGDNEYGQLGDGTETQRDVPEPVSGLSTVTAISAGQSQSLAVVAGGAVMAWGDNEEGQLGDGNHAGPEQCGAPPVFSCSKTPIRVRGLVRATEISAAVHSIALLADGTAMAWGPNNAGQLGDGTSNGPEMCGPSVRPCSTIPVFVSAPGVTVGISAGANFSLAFGLPRPTGQLPELGRCVRVASGGSYRGSSPRCISVSATRKGHFQWLPGPGPKAKFTEHLSEPRFETVGARKLSCVAASLEGEYTGSRAERIAHVTLNGCHEVAPNAACQTNPLDEGLIESSVPLEGDLGFMKSGAKLRVGWHLRPRPPATSLLSFECGSGPSAAAVSLEGSIIGLAAAPVDRMVSTFELQYKQRRGRQIPEFFQGEATNVLTLATTPFMGQTASEQAGLQSRGGRAGEEPLEIKTKA